MGYPANSVKMFHHFVQGTPEVIGAFGQYSLFAFVIYDPEREDDFHQHLCNNFKALHEDTGRNLLFIVPLQSDEILSLANDHHKFDPYALHKETRDRLGLDPRPFRKRGQPGLINRVVFQALELDRDSPPTLIICTHPNSGGYLTISVDTKSVGGHLIKLGEIANQLPRLKDSAQTNVDQMELVQQVASKGLRFNKMGDWRHSNTLKEKLAEVVQLMLDVKEAPRVDAVIEVIKGSMQDALRDTELVRIMTQGAITEARDSKRSEAISIVQRLQRLIGLGKEQGETEGQEEPSVSQTTSLLLTQLMDLLASKESDQLDWLSPKHTRYTQPSHIFTRLDDHRSIYQSITQGDIQALLEHQLKYWDEDARSMVVSALRSLIYMRETETLTDESFYGAPLIAFGLCMAFEREMNSSWGHYVRRSVQVRLPQYYWRFDPEADGSLSKRHHFNRQRTERGHAPLDDWQALSLGQLLEAIKAHTPDDPIFKTCSQELQVMWREVKALRDPPAHGTRITWASVNQLLATLRAWWHLEEAIEVGHRSWTDFKYVRSTKQNNQLRKVEPPLEEQQEKIQGALHQHETLLDLIRTQRLHPELWLKLFTQLQEQHSSAKRWALLNRLLHNPVTRERMGALLHQAPQDELTYFERLFVSMKIKELALTSPEEVKLDCAQLAQFLSALSRHPALFEATIQTEQELKLYISELTNALGSYQYEEWSQAVVMEPYSKGWVKSALLARDPKLIRVALNAMIDFQVVQYLEGRGELDQLESASQFEPEVVAYLVEQDLSQLLTQWAEGPHVTLALLLEYPTLASDERILKLLTQDIDPDLQSKIPEGDYPISRVVLYLVSNKHLPKAIKLPFRSKQEATQELIEHCDQYLPLLAHFDLDLCVQAYSGQKLPSLKLHNLTPKEAIRVLEQITPMVALTLPKGVDLSELPLTRLSQLTELKCTSPLGSLQVLAELPLSELTLIDYQANQLNELSSSTLTKIKLIDSPLLTTVDLNGLHSLKELMVKGLPKLKRLDYDQCPADIKVKVIGSTELGS